MPNMKKETWVYKNFLIRWISIGIWEAENIKGKSKQITGAPTKKKIKEKINSLYKKHPYINKAEQ